MKSISAAFAGHTRDGDQTDGIAEIDQRIDACRDALIELPEGSDGYLDTLEMLGNLHVDRFNLLSESHQDRNEAIDILREFCRLCPNSERRLLGLHRFAGLLQERAKLAGSMVFSVNVYRTAEDDYDEALSVEREALAICDKDHALYGHVLGRIGVLHLLTHDLSNLREGIPILRLAVETWPVGNPDRLEYLCELANGLHRLLVASDLSTAYADVDEVSKLCIEIAQYHIKNPTEYVKWLNEAASWMATVCKPPHRWVDASSKLSDLALAILACNSNHTNAKEYLIISNVAKEFQSGLLTNAALEVEEPDHQLVLNDIKINEDNTTYTLEDQNITEVYDTLLNPQEQVTQLLKNLTYLSQAKREKDTVGLAALNIGEILRKMGEKYYKPALQYLLWANQHISTDHEFYSILYLDITQTATYLYDGTRDLDDFKKSIRLEYLAPKPPQMVGPYFLSNPWTDESGPYGHKLDSDLESSYSTISYVRESMIKELTPRSKHTLVYQIFLHEKRFYTQNEEYFREMKQLLNETIAEESNREKYSVDMASIFLLQYRQTGKTEHLLSAIDTDCQHRRTHIEILYEKFLYEGNINDLNKAIKLASESYDIEKPETKNVGGGEAAMFLGKCLNARYFALGNEDDLTLSIERITLSTDKAQAYLYKYQKFGHAEDLEQVFQNGYFEDEEGRLAKTTEHFDYYDDFERRILHCHTLRAKCKLQSDTELLTEASNIISRCKALCPVALKPNLVYCYCLLVLDKSKNNLQELEDSINMCKEGLSCLSPRSIFLPHLKHVLGKLYYEHYEASNNFQYLNHSIDALKESASLSNTDSPSYGTIQYDLGVSLKALLNDEENDDTRRHGITAFQNVCNSLLSGFDIKYKAAIEWAKLAEKVDLKEALQAYEYVMNILPHLASLSLDIKNRHQRLIQSSLQGISGDAAACAIKLGIVEKAVEFLEHGRSIFWQQAMQLYSSVEILQNINPELAKQLSILARELNISGFHTQVKETSKNYQRFLSRESSKRIELAEKWNRLLQKAQSIPGCETLLKPMLYSKLAHAAAKSMVVLLSITTQTSYAIVIKNPESAPISLELPLVTRQYAETMAMGLQDILKGNNLRDAREEECVERAGKLYIPFNAALGDKKMYSILARLWSRIVKPVLDCMELTPSKQPVHITWCCTDILATLPIHAAGVYQGPKENLFEYAISSYTATLSNLLSSVSSISYKDAQILIAGMEKAPGYPVLPNVIKEIEYIKEAVIDTRTDTLIDSQATCNKLLENMANAHLVHLACHGVASPNPLDSAIILHDGHLKIDRLIRTPFKNAKLVFLSACQTAKINLLEADESIHIASAMLSTGFKSVVATLWSINDNDAPVVAKAFYEELIAHGRINVQESARALHFAVVGLRETGVSPLRWVPFIHMGV